MFIIGLPLQLRARLEGAARKKGIRISSVFADIGRKGSLKLLPDPSDAIHNLRVYYEQFGDSYEDASVLVLPYAPIPEDLENELDVLEDFGAKIVSFEEGNNDWPVLAKKTRPDTSFLNNVFHQLMEEIFGDDEKLPSDYFRSISERNPNIIIAKGALDTCDQVAEYRRVFFSAAADALIEMVGKNGKVGQIDAFFKNLGLIHAQSGGISTTLTVFRDGKRVHQRTTNTHLKKGDNTTPQAAARIYYQEFLLDQQCYVAILYAGPHPDEDISCEYDLSLH